MSTKDDQLDALQQIEFLVVDSYRTQPELNDFAVQQCYDTLLNLYGAEQRGTQPHTKQLSDLQQELFERLQDTIELRLGRAETSPENPPPPITLAELISCLRKLQKSVPKWTKKGGSRGYLNFVSQFL